MIKGFIRFVINKPILNHIFLFFLLILAVFAYNKIPKEIFPPSTLDAIVITGSYEGASPDILDKMAVKNIEDELKNLSDADTIISTIKNGSFSIKVDLKDGAKAENIINDAKDIVSNIRRDLPSDMDEPIVKVLEKVFPLVTIAIATRESKEKLLDVADELKSRLSRIKDLSDVSIRGDADKELILEIDEMMIRAYSLSRTQTISALSSLSSIFPIGIIKERGNHLFLSTVNGEKEIEKIKNSIITIDGKRLRVGDLATVRYELSDPNEISHFNGKPNVSVNINKAEAGDSITLVKQIKKILKQEYRPKYKNYDFDTYTDTSVWIRNRLNTVISNIIFGLMLVTLSVYIFVSGRIALVVGIGIPVSFMIGLIATEILGYSLNMLSLLGMLIALGMLVDEAIVVAENIYRHLENGDDKRTAAINGAAEMFPAVLTATATTIFAFLPLLIMSGEMGVFMRILPIMISILLLSSLVEAFFFLPLHAKDFLKVENKKEKTGAMWDWSKDFYKKVISFSMIYKKTILAVFLIFTVFSISAMLKNAKFQLFPEFDNTQIYVTGKVDINYDIEETQDFVTKVEEVLLENLPKNDVSSITSISGMKLDAKFRPEMGENNFHIFVNLYERLPENMFDIYINPYLSPAYDDSDMKRDRHAKDIAEQIKKLTTKFKNDKNYEEFNVVVPAAGIVKSDIEISFSGDNDAVKKAIEKAQNIMKDIDGVFNINNDLIEGERELKIRVNEYGASLGFNEKIISDSLRPFFLKAEVSKMFYGDDLIRIKSIEKNRDNFKTLNDFYLDVPGSFKKVRLDQIADFSYKPSYAEILKEDGNRIRTIYGSLDKTKITSGEFLKKMENVFEQIKKSGVIVDIKGEEKENKKIQKEMVQAAVIALFLIFIALVWMFDSLVLPVVIISTIPLAILGVLVGHYLMDMNLTMPGLLGVVGLSGVVVNDGIIMVDFIKRSREKIKVLELASLRLRPIMLTSITTILGLSTLMFFASGQAIILQPMAISLGFGIAWATVLNLFYVPLLYSVIYRVRS